MATQGPTPVDTGATALVVTRPIDRSPAPVAPGPGTTGRIPTVATPQGPPESAPPSVTPGPGTGQSTGPAATVTPAVIELPVEIPTPADQGNNVIPTVPNLIEVLADGTIIVQNASALNFTGSGVTATANGSTATLNITSGSVYGNSNVSTLLAGFGSNTISTTGNVTGGYILGNGSQLTGITTTYGNSNVSTYLGAGQVGNIIPLSNAVYSLGNATNQWAELYVSNNSIVIGGVTLAVSGNTLSVNGTALVTNTALGVDAGGIMQGYSAIAIGTRAGNINQGLKGIAIGDNCGYQNQASNSIAIGSVSGSYDQGTEAVALGRDTGFRDQGTRAIAVGTQAGNFEQAQYAIAFGYKAGQYSQGANSVSIGAYAGIGELSGGFQGNNSIVINATGANLTNQTANTFTVAPVRNLSNVGNIMFYNAATSEITYGNTINVAGNVTAGNVTTAGLISATGNISSNYFIGNGSLLTGIANGVSSYGNANVAANLAAFGSNPISTTGNVTAGNFIGNVVGGGAGTPTISSTTNLDLSAVSAVRVIGGGTFRLPSLTTAQIANTIAANGDMIYNSSVNKFQGYENGAWANII